jgi:hypothetical protein
MKQIHHPNIVDFYAEYQDKKKYILGAVIFGGGITV